MLLLVACSALLAALHADLALAKVYERCELARELRDVHGVPADELAVWVCIARHESEFNTTAVGHVGDGGDHGLFQISDLYWCSHSGRGKACRLSCTELLDDNIGDDVACVRRIYREHQGLSGNGFSAWAVYAQHCKRPERAAKYVEGCFTGPNEIQRPHDAYGLPPPAITAPPPRARPAPRPSTAASVYGVPTTTTSVRPAAPVPALSSRWSFSAAPRRPAVAAPQPSRRIAPVTPAPAFAFTFAPRPPQRAFPQPPQRAFPQPPQPRQPQRAGSDPRNFWNWQHLPTRRWF